MTLALWPDDEFRLNTNVAVHMSRAPHSQRTVVSACGQVVDIEASTALTGNWRDVTCRSCERTRWYQAARRNSIGRPAASAFH